MNIKLEDLIGSHSLTGAFYDSVNEPRYEGSDEMEDKIVLRFTLNAVHYEAVEDPCDGYRSSLDALRICDTAPANTFAPVAVIGRMRPKSEDDYAGEDHVLQLLNPETLKPIIEIGTSNADDYYPGFVAYFSPENLPRP